MLKNHKIAKKTLTIKHKKVIMYMLTFAYFSSRINSLFNEKIYKYVGILIVILGILMMKPSLNFT